MRILLDDISGLGHAHFIEHFHRDFARFRFADILVIEDGFHDLIADGEERVKRGHRFLENHSDFRSTHLAQRFASGVEGGQVFAIDGFATEVMNGAAHDSAGRTHEAQNGKASDRFAASALAEYTEGAAAFDLQGNAINSGDDATLGEEVRLQVGDFQQVRMHGAALN